MLHIPERPASELDQTAPSPPSAVDRACTPLEKYQAITALREIDKETCFALIRQVFFGRLVRWCAGPWDDMILTLI